MLQFTSKIMMISILFGLLSLAVTHDLTVDGASPSVSINSAGADHSNDAPGADKCEVCHIFQHMDVPVPQLVWSFSGEDRAPPGGAADAESLAHTPDGPPPQYLIA